VSLVGVLLAPTADVCTATTRTAAASEPHRHNVSGFRRRATTLRLRLSHRPSPVFRHVGLQQGAPLREPSQLVLATLRPTAGSAWATLPEGSLRVPFFANPASRRKSALEGSIVRKSVYTLGGREAEFRPREEKDDA
jgi:hypothetical protein